jgi:O-acetyl-ADP-ribose deacetylase (regulator of RNase III)
VGTGIAGFPMKECAEVMLQEALRHLERGSSLEKIYFVLFDEGATETFKDAFRVTRASPTLAAAPSES